MSACFVDTSAAYAALDSSDEHHDKAVAIWERLLTGDDVVIASNYVVVETTALAQARLGVDAARGFLERIVPLLRIVWVDEEIHNEAAGAFALARKKRLSLVDCTSFLIMRRLGIHEAFAFDRHFNEQGYRTLTKSS